MPNRDELVGQAAARERLVISFGDFSLTPSERLLTKTGVPVEPGARALDTLVALAPRPNDMTGKGVS